MIYLEIAGRAGNQLFRYFAVKELTKDLNEEFYIGFKHVYKHGWENDLKQFSLNDYKEDCDGKILNTNASNIQKILIFIYKLYYKIFQNNKLRIDKFQHSIAKLYNKQGIYISDLSYVDFKINSKVKTKIFLGCFESPKYIEKINKDFLKNIKISDKNFNLYEKIQKKESVCITIRRGDFLENDEHNICNSKFYYDAIEIMKKELKNPCFFVFSDDINWCKKNIKDKELKFYYESGNDSLSEKMKLMSSCKHFIVSNSTFSWWAQFLGKSKEKKVIGPTKLYKYNIKSELIDNNWIKL